MSLQSLAIQNFRNIKNAEIQPASGINLIFGENAAGKTTILEAIHTLSTTRSFRSLHIEQIINHESDYLLITGVIENNNRIEKIGIKRSKNDIRLRLNGSDINKSSVIAQKLPVHVINPEAHQLLEQGPKIRRKMLDWGVFHVEHEFVDLWRTFNRILKQRNSALRQGSKYIVTSLNPQFIEISEQIDNIRRHYVTRLQTFIQQFCGELIGKVPDIEYLRGWNRDKSLYDVLDSSLLTDLDRGYTASGPHRAEIRFKFEDKLAQTILSRGQQKMLVSSVIMAQVALFHEDTGRESVLLVDDLAAELDTAHRQQLLSLLFQSKAQLFVTVTEHNLVDLTPWKSSKMFHVEHGNVKEVV